MLAASLADWDARGIPSDLASTNSANLHRHRRAGLDAIGSSPAVFDDSEITTMWRPIGER